PADGDRGIDINTLKVYLDTRDSTRPESTQFSTMTVDLSQIPSLPTGSSATYTGRFTVLAPGVAYTVDPSSGIITFKNALTKESVVAIDYLPPGVTDPTQSIAQTRGITTVPAGAPPNPPNVPGVPKAVKWDESQITKIPD